MPHYLAGFVFHRHHACRMVQGDAALQGRVAGQQLGQFTFIAVQDEIGIGHLPGTNGKTGDYSRRSTITAHGVNRKYNTLTRHTERTICPFGKRACGIRALARACHGCAKAFGLSGAAYAASSSDVAAAVEATTSRAS